MAALCICKIEDLPFNYLGIPLGADPRKIATWDSIVERFSKNYVDGNVYDLPLLQELYLLIRYYPLFQFTSCLFFKRRIL